ncbi:MAG: hypothetical protein QW358_02105 [Candidatus Hadarchaeum sp.]
MMDPLKPVVAVLLGVILLFFSFASGLLGAELGGGLNDAYGVSLSYGYEKLSERALQLAAWARIGAVRTVLNWFQLMDNPRQNPRAATMGLLDRNAEPKPAYSAYRELTGGLAAYQRTLDQVLDKYRPVVLAVENEENSALFYTGTPQDYTAQL